MAELAKVGAPPLQLPAAMAGPDPVEVVRAGETQRTILAWIAWRAALTQEPDEAVHEGSPDTPTEEGQLAGTAAPAEAGSSAGGDAEEIERFGLVDACGQLLAGGQIKLYSVDSVAGQAMITKAGSPEHRMWLLNQFHQCIRQEVVPAIHADLGGQALDVIASGASIGAFNAVAVLCRYPDVFSAAIGMSGSYRIERFYDQVSSPDLYFSAPLQFLPGLEGPQLDLLRQRFAVLAAGEGGRTPASPGRWHPLSVRRGSPTGWTTGARDGNTTGQRGTGCCRST
jgi:esterase/lipase superfamily enzyme